MSDALTNTRFFFESEVHSWLFNQYDAKGENNLISNCNFGYDIIDQPFYCELNSGENNVEMKICVRSEMGSFVEMPDMGIKFCSSEAKTEVTASSGRLGENPGEIATLFLKAGAFLCSYIDEKGRMGEFSDLNADEEGVLVTLEGDELLFERVVGKKRPSMACTTLFGGIQLMRPYQDEIMDKWMGEMMPLEEKIELAEDGDEDMMEQLAMLYLNGDEEVEADPQKAVYWFERLAELENSDAQFNLGLHCAKGFGIERSFKKAVYWLEHAAENGDEDAPALIDKLQKAVVAEEIVATGDAQAQADLAAAYMFIGNSLEQAGPEHDYAIAFDLAQKSAAQDNGDGIWTLALAYEHGRGVASNVDIAIGLYERGAELGHAPSQHSLACYYFRGDVLEKNNQKAFELCMKSAEQGYGLAMKDVGRCYQFGTGVMGNMKTAVEWYEKALEVIHDPELTEKTETFKMMSQFDEHWGDDYPGDEENFDDGMDEGDGLPDGFMLALEAFEEAEEYESELADIGVLPDAPHLGNDVMNLSVENFPRIALMAEEGDERALEIIAKMNAANELA